MKLRSILPLMLLAMQSALPGQDAAELLRKGEDALASGMWEMAALHFNDCLTSRNLSADDKSQAAIRLAEALIRDGKPKDALDLLDHSFVSQHPERLFWQAQALLGLGRFTDAVGSFATILNNPAAPHRSEAAFSMANVELALDRPEAALATLASLTKSPDATQTTRARLRQAEILLDLGRTAEARQAIPAADSISPADQAYSTFLQAHLLLKEGRPADAASTFQTLMNQPQGQSLHRYHAAAVGLADALRASESPDAAAGFLISFIQENPDSPQLEALFDRLLDALPAKPTANDPILDHVAQWITPSELRATGPLATLEAGAIGPCPGDTTTPTSNLLAFSLYTRAMGLHRIGSPEARAEAKRLLTRLRVEYPDHLLANRTLFEMARWALDENLIDRAFAMLDTLRDTAKSPAMIGEAAFLAAKTSYTRGDKEQAIRLFDESAKSLAGNEAKTARLNAAIIRLAGASGNTTTILQTDQPEDGALAADLELERALSNNDPAAKRTAIEEFLTGHPDHPRVPEVRLAAAEAALAVPAPDLSFARAQLDTLAAAPEKSAALSPSRIALIRLRIEDLSKNSAVAIATARTILEEHAGEPAAAEAALILGRNLFQTRSYNDARLVLEKLAASDTDPGRAQAAWLLAARSAALVPTSQSQQEALILFDKVIGFKDSLAAIAKLEKARLMIDMNRLAEASAFLRKWFDALPDTDPLHLPAGLLLGEATYAQGSARPESLTEALAVYDKLLSHAEKQPAVFNRLQYLRGKTLEQMPDDKDPSGKRRKQAFIAYYSVLETSTPPVEWDYFERCGFKALELLENAGRWPAAIACAKKIASFNGPRAKDAANLASQLQLKHMIWED